MTVVDLQILQQKIGYQFKNSSLLRLALTHRSARKINNERLEFLGDSILSAVIAKALYQKFSFIDEGKLTRLRSELIRGKTLAEIAFELALSDYLILGQGELKSGGASCLSILENALEALFGAIFLDANFAEIERIILNIYKTRLIKIKPNQMLQDAKTHLQEYLQKNSWPLPSYRLINTKGKNHEAIFTILCELLKPKISVTKQATSIKHGEQNCAHAILEKLSESKKSKTN